MPKKRAAYPTRESANKRWRGLAREIVGQLDEVSEATLGRMPEKPGRLTVLGSGIGTMGFTRDAERRIRAADEVLFCVADPATEAWIRQVRPDAYDLYVLYNDSKRRLKTYTQMSEAILYFVRKGKNVVCVFYGHPGIFVHSSHRAIEIARREGHSARMMPGISALDCLCADLGVDPAYPGLQTFEATDLLLRARPIDTSSHLVLWQVGLIGQLGFRRRGFINSNFGYLVDYLAGYYGEAYEITHYIAARYPTLDPVIERFRIADLRDRALLRKFTGISSFYVPPKHARPVERRFAEAVGIVEPGQRLMRPRTRRALGNYGPKEMAALRELSDFEVPPDYHFQEQTGGTAFLLALADDDDLCEKYRDDPDAALSDRRFRNLTGRERAYLASRNSTRIQLAAKGSGVELSPTEKFVIALMSRSGLAVAFMNQVANLKRGRGFPGEIDAWIQSVGFPGASMNDYQTALTNVEQSQLVAWTGAYLDSSGAVSLAVIGNAWGNSASAVYYNAQRVIKPAFSNSTLTWSTNDGNPNNGSFTFHMPADKDPSNLRTVVGKVWVSGSSSGAPQITLEESLPPTSTLNLWIGVYDTTLTLGGSGAGPRIAVGPPPANSDSATLTVGGTSVPDYKFSNKTVTWGSGNSLTFGTVKGTSGSMTVTGTVGGEQLSGTSVASDASGFAGEHATQISANNVWTQSEPLYFDGSTLIVGGTAVTGFKYANRALRWSGAGGPYDSGELYFSVNTLTGQTGFSGTIWAAGKKKPGSRNYLGALDANLAVSWAGLYTTKLSKKSGPALLVQWSSSGLEVYLDGQTATVISQGDKMLGSVGTDTKFSVEFSTPSKGDPSFTGTLTIASGPNQPWSSTQQANDISKWGGDYNSLVESSDKSNVAGPPIKIASSGSGSSAKISVTVGFPSGPVTITSAAYDASNNALYWERVSGTPNGDFANAALVFNSSGEVKHFTGSYWANESKPPAKANWSGQTSVVKPSHTTGWIIGGILIGAVAIAGIYGLYVFFNSVAWQLFRFRVARRLGGRVREYYACEMHEDLVMRTRSNIGLVDSMAGDNCEEEEDEMDDELDDAEADAGEAAENDPEPPDIDESFDPYPDDPDVQVEAETDAEVEVEAEAEVESGVEITAEELFFDEDFADADAARIDFVSGQELDADR